MNQHPPKTRGDTNGESMSPQVTEPAAATADPVDGGESTKSASPDSTAIQSVTGGGGPGNPVPPDPGRFNLHEALVAMPRTAGPQIVMILTAGTVAVGIWLALAGLAVYLILHLVVIYAITRRG